MTSQKGIKCTMSPSFAATILDPCNLRSLMNHRSQGKSHHHSSLTSLLRSTQSIIGITSKHSPKPSKKAVRMSSSHSCNWLSYHLWTGILGCNRLLLNLSLSSSKKRRQSSRPSLLKPSQSSKSRSHHRPPSQASSHRRLASTSMKICFLPVGNQREI